MRLTVVGGGVIGLLTAVEGVLAGHRVTVLDAGELPTQTAASFDRHRIMRALHPKDSAATGAGVRAHHRWLELERLLFARFYDRVGALTVLPDDELADGVSALWNCQTQAQVLRPDQLASRYPHLIFPAQRSAVFESDAGVLLADRVLAACVAWLRGQPHVRLLPHTEVIRVNGETATVITTHGAEMVADAVVVAMGPRSRRLLPVDIASGLTLYRQSMIYCQVPSDLDAWASTPAIPSLGTSTGSWLVPPVAGTPLKLSSHSACRVVDSVTDNATSKYWRKRLVDEFRRWIPHFSADWVMDSRDCYYLTDTLTTAPVVASLGERVVSYAACGGGSFKFAPLIAQALLRRAIGLPYAPVGLAALDRQPLSLDRQFARDVGSAVRSS
ncbi:MAG: FAD-binding oxidoreductase [Sciscionella sp.]|nr:FAD-binding oxidoreductase [Sciscionella sp.]